MGKIYLVAALLLTASSCGHSDNNQATLPPPYGREILSKQESKVNTFTIDYYVHPDTLKQYGTQNVLLLLAGQDCGQVDCWVNIWDNKDAYFLNRDNPYGQRKDAWQKKHYVSIADHLIAFKNFGSDEIINYPLTYDANYKRWGGKIKH